jgi:nucleoside-diphosphate-sugar epimerase
MRRVLVTGGTGFLGGHLADAFEREGWLVRAFDLHPHSSPSPERELVVGDVRDRTAVRAAARGCEVVVDNAALVPVTRATPDQYRSVNVDGCRTTLEAAADEGAYALHISSSAIFGVPEKLPVTDSTPFEPFEPYGASKAEADRLVSSRRRTGLVVGSLRPRTLVGRGRLGIFDVIFARIQAGRRVPLFGRGMNRVQLCDVEDFCRAALAAVRLRANDDFNVGSAAFGTVREDMEGLIAAAGTSATVQPVPVWAIRALLEPLDRVGRSPFNQWHWRSAPESFYFDLSKTAEALAWTPRRSNLETLVNAYEHYLREADETGASAHRQQLAGMLARMLRGSTKPPSQGRFRRS